jgi:DNA-binding NarL/FixJ family response regulator
MSISVALVEDNKVNRNTFMQKINLYADIQMIFSAVNGHDFLEELKGLPRAKLPQVVFMDLEMPEMNGIQAIGIAKSLYPQIQFVVLTVFDDDEKIFEAIKAGASGYLLKHEPAAVLHDAITNVLEFGGAPMSPAIARKSLSMLSKSDFIKQPAAAMNDMDMILSEREKEILQHTINGLDAKKIAEILKISVLTVRKHIANIYEKLHVNSKAQIISLAHKKKWV